MRVEVEFINGWAETLNRLSNKAASQQKAASGEEALHKLLVVGGQLPFDPAVSPRESVHAYNRFVAALMHNRFLAVYTFLQAEGDLFEETQRALGLHMGIFAYVDAATNAIRYLYGPGDYSGDGSDDATKPQPHLLLKAFFEFRRPLGEDLWITEPHWHFARMAEAFYYSRKREGRGKSVWDTGFVKLLSSNDEGKQRSEWERTLGVIYAPSGEMDACILSWLGLHLEEDGKRQLLEWCVAVGHGDVLRPPPPNFSFPLEESAIRRTRTFNEGRRVEESYYWGQGRSRSILEWLGSLGLVGPSAGGVGIPYVSPKGRAMSEWLGWYVGQDGDRPVDVAKVGDWLQTDECASTREMFRSLIDRTYPHVESLITNGARTKLGVGRPDRGTTPLHRETSADLEYRTLVAGIALLLSWGAGWAEDLDEPAQTFATACRMNLHSHLILRAGTRHRSMVENLPRAWLVFPVLLMEQSELLRGGSVSREDIAQIDSLVPVGFFLATVRDLGERGDTNPSLDKRERSGFARKIAAIRALVHPLAEIENRETFFMDINTRKLRMEEQAKVDILKEQLTAVMMSETEDRAALVKEVMKTLQRVLVTAGYTGAGSANISRFRQLHILYEKIHDLLHYDRQLIERNVIPVPVIGASELRTWLLVIEHAALILNARDDGLDQAHFGLARDVQLLKDLADGIRTVLSEDGELSVLDRRSVLTLLGFASTFKSAIRLHARTHTALQELLDVNFMPVPPGGELSFQAVCAIDTEAWHIVFVDHFESSTTRCVPIVDGKSYWIVIEGVLRQHPHTGFSGGYEAQSATDDVDLETVLGGSTGRLWITSMVPRYFSPVLLENCNSKGWVCWNLTLFGNGVSCDVTLDEYVRLLPPEVTRLAAPGVRLLIHVTRADIEQGGA